MTKFISLFGFLFVVFLISAISSKITMPAIHGWYATINKPSFNPPDWVFPPVWTTLYVMIAVSGWLVWNKLPGSFTAKISTPQIKIYFLQLLANFAWSVIFFGMKMPLLAFVDISIMLVLIALNIRSFKKYSRPAAWLLVPYFLWVSFAAVLNLSIVTLN